MKTALFLVALTVLAGTDDRTFASETNSSAMGEANPTASANTLSLYDQGIAAVHQKDFKKALQCFSRVVQDNPKNPDALNMLAFSQRKLGHMDEAIANYQRALVLRPNFREAMQYLSEAYVELGEEQVEQFRKTGDTARCDEGIANYKKALALTPNFAEAREYLGEAYLAAAVDQVARLKKLGDDAKDDLEDLTNDFRKAEKDL